MARQKKCEEMKEDQDEEEDEEEKLWVEEGLKDVYKK